MNYSEDGNHVNDHLLRSFVNITSFGVDADNELYIVGHNGGIYELEFDSDSNTYSVVNAFPNLNDFNENIGSDLDEDEEIIEFKRELSEVISFGKHYLNNMWASEKIYYESESNKIM